MSDDLNYCARCGAPLAPQQEDGQPFLVCANAACRRVMYRNAKPCAGVLVERDRRVLLAQRAVATYKGDWDVPGGFLAEWEHPADGALREVR